MVWRGEEPRGGEQPGSQSPGTLRESFCCSSLGKPWVTQEIGNFSCPRREKQELETSSRTECGSELFSAGPVLSPVPYAFYTHHLLPKDLSA